MEKLTLSKKELKKLFVEAAELSRMEPWKKLNEEDIFVIKFHDMEEIILCSILGSRGSMKGMALYIGPDGIESYFRLIEGRYDLQLEQIHIADSYVIYLDDRNKIDEGDYTLIKEAGLSFNKKKERPSFRRNEPGFVPRSMKEEELMLIGRILNVANYGLSYCQKHPEKLLLKNVGKYPMIEVKEDDNFEETTITYDFLQQETIKVTESASYPVAPCNELELKRVGKACRMSHYTVEMDYFNYGVAVDDEGKPYFPAVLLIVDQHTNIVGYHITEMSKAEEAWQQYLIEWLREKKILPQRIILINKRLFRYVKNSLGRLGVKVELRQKLEHIPCIKKDYFSNRII